MAGVSLLQAAAVLGLVLERGLSHDHGVLCTSQFNYWYRFAPNAASKLLGLASAAGYPGLDACSMQQNANQLYHMYVAAGGIGYPANAEPGNGGFNEYCNATGGGVPAGGCAFSYPVSSIATCRVKVFGPSEVMEVQWCMSDIAGTMAVGAGSTGLGSPDSSSAAGLCTTWTAFNTFDQDSTAAQQSCKTDHGCYCTDPSTSSTNYQSSVTTRPWSSLTVAGAQAVLFLQFANTLVQFPDCTDSGGGGGTDWHVRFIVVLAMACCLAVGIVACAVWVYVLYGRLAAASASPTQTPNPVADPMDSTKAQRTVLVATDRDHEGSIRL